MYVVKNFNLNLFRIPPVPLPQPPQHKPSLVPHLHVDQRIRQRSLSRERDAASSQKTQAKETKKVVAFGRTTKVEARVFSKSVYLLTNKLLIAEQGRKHSWTVDSNKTCVFDQHKWSGSYTNRHWESSESCQLNRENAKRCGSIESDLEKVGYEGWAG